MAPPRSLEELNEDLTAEILLRVGPDEPAGLFRASLACKLWHRILSDPGFLRRYRAFHRCPPSPLLGFFYNLDFPGPFSRFVAATPGAFPLPFRGFNARRRRVSWALDCRHGRVLFKKTTGSSSSRGLAVWDPIADVWTELPLPAGVSYESYSAVVLCDVAGCDHRDCRRRGGGRFLVVCMGRDVGSFVLRACVYSSEDRAWGAPFSDGTRSRDSFDVKRPAVIGHRIYCNVGGGDGRILKYDLVERRFSWIAMPYSYRRAPVLLQNEDGSLGLAGIRRGSTLCLWSGIWNAEGLITGWAQLRVIKLRKMLPPAADGSAMKANVIGFAEGVGVFFVMTNVGVFTVELNSGRVMKVCRPSNNHRTAFPFISYFTPGPDHA